MSKSSNFFGQPTWRHGRMDKTAAHHRFNYRKFVLQHHFQGCWTTSEDRQEERRYQSPRCDTRQRGRAMRRTVHVGRDKRLVHARSEPLQAR